MRNLRETRRDAEKAIPTEMSSRILISTESEVSAYLGVNFIEPKISEKCFF